VGTGRGLKPRGEKAAARGRSEYPSGLVFAAIDFADDFWPCNFFAASHLANWRLKGSKTNMLAAASAGLATNQIA